jgi:hypothetical protein
VQEFETSAEQAAIATRVQEAIDAELALLAAEGIDPTLLVAGTCFAAAKLIGNVYGAEHVAPLFRRQARLATELGWGKP